MNKHNENKFINFFNTPPFDKNKEWRHWTLFAVLLAAIIIWDMITKALTDGYTLLVWDGVINFVSAHNTGAAGSILSEHTWLLTTFSILFILTLIVVDLKIKIRHSLYTVSFALIIGGGLGNLIDRLAFNYVRDFIALDFINFPIFNLADSCLTIGVILMIIFVFFVSPKIKKKSAVKSIDGKHLSQNDKQNKQLDLDDITEKDNNTQKTVDKKQMDKVTNDTSKPDKEIVPNSEQATKDAGQQEEEYVKPIVKSFLIKKGKR